MREPQAEKEKAMILLEDLREQPDPVGVLARACDTIDELLDHLDGLLTVETNHPHYVQLLLLKTDLERSL